MSNPYLSIAEAAAALRTGDTTSVELTRTATDLADAHDQALGMFLTRFTDAALDAAQAADQELAAGKDRGPLHGIPLAIKDIIATADGPTTAQSLILDADWGKQGDAPVVARLREAGAIMVGKTTTMEFAVGVPDPDKPFPIPRNPWQHECWPGGSSSGTGAAVALGAALGGLGTDTGGSVRCPAAFCGISGLKQTFGRVPKSGCVPLGYSYDHIGPMSRSAEDCAQMLNVMAGHDPSDATSVDVPVPDYTTGLTGSLAGLRIGVDPLAHAASTADPAVAEAFDAAVAELAAAGATVVLVELPLYRELTAATMMGFCGEAFAYHRDDLRSRWMDYGRGTRMAVARGALVSAGDYAQAQRVRRVGQRALKTMFDDVDLVVTPTASAPAPKVADLDFQSLIGLLHTPYWNAVGAPALSVPMGFSDELPLGLQIAGRPFEEATVLAAGHAYQQRTEWHRRLPAMVGSSLAA